MAQAAPDSSSEDVAAAPEDAMPADAEPADGTEMPADAAQEEDPMAAGGDDMAPDGGDSQNSVYSMTVELLKGLDQEDQKAARNYIMSLSDKSEEGDGMDAGMEEPAEAAPAQPDVQPMQESVIFTKRQLKEINENFDLLDKSQKQFINPINKKSGNRQIKKTSPFGPKKFNKK